MAKSQPLSRTSFGLFFSDRVSMIRAAVLDRRGEHENGVIHIEAVIHGLLYDEEHENDHRENVCNNSSFHSRQLSLYFLNLLYNMETVSIRLNHANNGPAHTYLRDALT